MAAASFQTRDLGYPDNQGKITKSRARTSVKPILKKLHSSSSYSEKNSLDLGRGWDDQQSPNLGYVSPDSAVATHGTSNFKHYYSGDDTPELFGTSHAAGAVCGTGGRPARDVSFDLAATDLTKGSLAAAGGGGGDLATTSAVTQTTTVSTVNSTSATSAPTTSAFSHVRSTSGASHISTATSNSGRNGFFVHPFQQTPRASTPPLLSYAANSTTSLDNTNPQRDYSSTTITENDDDECLDPLALAPPNSRTLQPTPPHLHSSSGHRRPSLASNQRTSSLSDITPPLRVPAARGSSGAVPRASCSASVSVNQSRLSDNQLGPAPSVTVVADSPISATAGPSPEMAAPSPASASPMSPLRHSLDMNHFRIRSRSDVDTISRQEQVRLARRRFEEKEKAKEEKYAREQDRKRERAHIKEAQRHERAHSGKNSYNGTGRRSTSDIPTRPSMLRKSTSHSHHHAAQRASNDLARRGYHDTATSQSPTRADEVHFEPNQRSRANAKRKTTGAWTAFVLWLRTRLLKLGRR